MSKEENADGCVTARADDYETAHADDYETAHVDDYETISPNMFGLMNAFTMIYNQNDNPNDDKPRSLVEGINPRVPNDTSDIQEDMNSIMVRHLELEELHKDLVDVLEYNDDEPIDLPQNVREEIQNQSMYALLKDGVPVYRSYSKLALLICASRVIDRVFSGNMRMNIVPIV